MSEDLSTLALCTVLYSALTIEYLSIGVDITGTKNQSSTSACIQFPKTQQVEPVDRIPHSFQIAQTGSSHILLPLR